jgi:hypothetical protein
MHGVKTEEGIVCPNVSRLQILIYEIGPCHCLVIFGGIFFGKCTCMTFVHTTVLFTSTNLDYCADKLDQPTISYVHTS